MENELNRCGDKLDFHKHIIAVLCMAIVLISAMLYFCKTTEAGGFLEIGQSTFNKPDNTLWWQDGYPNAHENKGHYLRFGVETNPENSLGVRASVFTLGRYTLDAIAAIDESCYLANGASSQCGTTGRFKTTGSMRGIGITGIARWRGTYFEVGPVALRQSFQLDLTIDGCCTYNYHEVARGGGYMYGLGHNITDRFGLSVYKYRSNISGVFRGEEYPAGVADVVTISLNLRF